jgi:hypothetical protein
MPDGSSLLTFKKKVKEVMQSSSVLLFTNLHVAQADHGLLTERNLKSLARGEKAESARHWLEN